MAVSLQLALAACSSALLAACSPLLLRGQTIQRSALSLLLAIAGVLAMAAGFTGLIIGGGAITLPLGLPWLPLHAELDALGAFFLLVIGSLLFPVAIYSHGYLRHEERITPLLVFMPLFALGMMGVVLAGDALAFMLFWELMSVSSYFLVTHDHQHLENRKAGFIYLLMAHMAGLLILGSFATLYAASGSFEFT
ncbi:MAG: proton-conducting transporter membrane subunit, partial [Mariprofundaceae bacterium]|nr:proton-conducting transporter membrane subunit [Mariprofundaceae bacterium]